MILIVVYDIEKTKVRNKIADFLEKKGIRIQKSVFLVEISRHYKKDFLKTLKKLSDETSKVAIFEQCKNCMKTAVKIDEDNPNFYVF